MTLCDPLPIRPDEIPCVEAAELFGVALHTIHRWADRGLIPARMARGVGQGGFTRVLDRKAVDEFLAKRDVAREALAAVGQTLR